MAPDGDRGASWDPAQYLRFEAERSLPCKELIARLGDPAPARIVDLGCGAGTSTEFLKERWPGARLLGLDRSSEMIAEARQRLPAVEWVVGDLTRWTPEEPLDLVFSNAALQWVPDHATLFPRLLGQVAAGGALAVQMPVNFDSGGHRAVYEIAGSPRWASRWRDGVALPAVAAPEEYYRWLVPRASRVELWQTEYVHVMPGPEAILEWLKGTTLRPYLTRLGNGPEAAEFLAEIGHRLAVSYPRQPDGRVLYPFRRLFVIARA